MKKHQLFLLCIWLLAVAPGAISAKERVYDLAKLGLKADSKRNASPVLRKVIDKIKAECAPTDSVVLRFAPGRYEFHEKGASQREYYISNHDQVNPKKVGLALEGFHHLTLDGQGAELVFHGRMLPLALVNSAHCTLQNFRIDFAHPHIAQIKVVENSPVDGLTFEVAPWVNYRITKDSVFETYGEGWTARQGVGIAFEEKTKHLVYQTSDLYYSTKGVKEVSPRVLNAPAWKNERLVLGTVIAMRTWERPAPGIFFSHNVNTTVRNVKVHYAEGMGLLAQLCENITLDGFSVCLKGEQDPRYFTTQADATHFSGCKGLILSKSGLYEGMMDDAINVHGTYLKVVKRMDDHTLVGRYMHDQSWGFDWGNPGDRVQFIRSAAINVHGTYLKVVKRMDDHTLVGRYMHDQSWGFDWGNPGDRVQFIRSATMDLIGEENRITAIRPYDKEEVKGAREFVITFEKPVAVEINEHAGFGIEDLIGEENRITAIRPYDKEEVKGAREFVITFEKPVAVEINEHAGFGIENLTWTPQVVFSDNVVRNNRARGALFSTPQDVLVENNLFDHTSGTAILNLTWTPQVVFSDNVVRNNRARGALFSTPQDVLVENNLFDHTSGTAILLCGDCNGWYETGACRKVVIRRNRFINALTNLFQFTNAVISIYPEIPNLAEQEKFFHGGKDGGILIEDNVFETFDAPILYAKSVDGLIYRRNTVKVNSDYSPFHWNKDRFLLERVTNVKIAE